MYVCMYVCMYRKCLMFTLSHEQSIYSKLSSVLFIYKTSILTINYGNIREKSHLTGICIRCLISHASHCIRNNMNRKTKYTC